MFEFPSKPIQMLGNLVLCQDGSIYRYNETLNKINEYEYDQVISYEKVAVYSPSKKEKKQAESHYTTEFVDFWNHWNSYIKNNSNKRNSYLNWKKLSDLERSLLFDSVVSYSKTSNEPQYLKRCETYINQKHWENIDVINDIAKEVIPPMSHEVWDIEIFDQESGITEKARDHVEKLGMDKMQAWRLIGEK